MKYFCCVRMFLLGSSHDLAISMYLKISLRPTVHKKAKKVTIYLYRCHSTPP